MDTKGPGGHGGRRRWPIAVGGVVVLGALGALALTGRSGSAGSVEQRPTFRVRQGPLTISVVESGTIESREQVSLKSEVEGQTTLIYLVPEGTRVSEGDLLVELDASKLEDNLTQQQISVDNAEASFIRARESLAVAKNQAQSDISKAELEFRFAQEDVTQYVKGELPQQVKEEESSITLAREELERAAEKLKWSERLFKEQYISQTELEADRLTHNRAKLNHELAVTSLELLQEYTSKRKLDELQSNVEQAKMALERVKLQANADIVQASASLKAAETELTQQKTKFEKYEQQLSKTRIVAPRSGLVVHATSVARGGRRRRQEPLEEGQAVRERQELIYLPSPESMMAAIQIHESSLEKVQTGLPVRVTIDALAGQTFAGQVAKIAPLPDAQSSWMNPDLKVYPTEIHLDGTHPELRTGMSCRAEIIVEQHTDAVHVPIQAVVRIGSQPTVYIANGKDGQPRPIEIGLDNNAMVHVLSGLQAGEEIMLTPPLGQAGPPEEAAVSETPAVQSAPETAAPETPTPQGEPGARGGSRQRGEKGERRGDAEQSPPDAERQQGRSPFGNMTPEQRAQMRKRFEEMSPEEREEARRKRMESLTPEQREQFQRRRERGGGERSGRREGRP